MIFLIGWGNTGSENPDTLREANTPFMPDNQCAQQVGNGFNPQTQLCTSFSEGTGTCNGDSGGPLVCLSTQNKWVSNYLQQFKKLRLP